MDYSSRQRYRSRRALIAARRRIGLAAGIVLALAVLGLVYRWPADQPAPPSATPPPAADVQPSAPAASAPAPSATAAQSRATAATLAAATPLPAPAAGPAPFFDDRRFIYEPDLYAPQIQAFLDTQPGPLKQLSFLVGDRKHTFAEALSGQTSYVGINPKVVLALLELQSQTLSTAEPSADQIGWAMGYQGENGRRRGLAAQVRWAVRQLVNGKIDYPRYAPLTYADNSSTPPPLGLSMSEYAVAYALAPTTTPDRLHARLRGFLETYLRLFDDPRLPPAGWPPPSAPFLSRPSEQLAPVTSFFDHDTPSLRRNNTLITYWGRAETDIAFAYDSHDGWDYAMMPPQMALAAADGDVVFAGNADDNCATRAVILDHGNGYRTLYWHLSRVDVAIGQRVARGQPVGMIGASGCASGPHLHFGVQYLGRNIDPYGWCGANDDPWAQHPAGVASVWLWVDRPSPCMPPPTGAVLVDTDSPGFSKEGDGWQSISSGYGGSALFVPSARGLDHAQPWDLRPLVRPVVAIWRPSLPAAGRYRVLAYVPYALSGLDDATRVRYRVRYAGGEAEIVVDEEAARNDWVDLGTYVFDPADAPLIAMSNLVEADQRSVWADAIMWLPVGQTLTQP